MSEDEKQKYFEEGYDQCFREVVETITEWNHPDAKHLIKHLGTVFKLSAGKCPEFAKHAEGKIGRNKWQHPI